MEVHEEEGSMMMKREKKKKGEIEIDGGREKVMEIEKYLYWKWKN